MDKEKQIHHGGTKISRYFFEVMESLGMDSDTAYPAYSGISEGISDKYCSRNKCR